MSETMKAVVYTGYKKLEYLDVPVPECGEYDIIVEVKAASICGADLHWYTGVFDDSDKAPFILGHEFCGVIHKMGSKADPYWKVGDRVACDNTATACGRCETCSRGDFVRCEDRIMMGGGLDGCFAKYIRIPGKVLNMYPNALMRLPDSISFEEGALLEPAAGSFNAVVQEAQIIPGDTIVVYGLGALGFGSVQAAKIAGAGLIIAVGMKSDKEVRFPLAKKLGADYVFAADEEENLAQKIKDLTREDPARILIDAVGAPSVMEDGFKFLARQSKIIRIGNMEAMYNHSLLPIHQKALTVIGHIGYNTVSWNRVITLAKKGKYDLKSPISTVIPLSDWDKGFQLMLHQKVAKLVMIP